MPKLAAFPKAYLDEMADGSMTIEQWLEMAVTLGVDGLEWYGPFHQMQDERYWPEARRKVEDLGLVISMMCCSPDFTHHDAAFRQEQIDREKLWIDMTAALGAPYCRILSGQRRPDVSREDGIRYTVDAIEACLPHAADRGVTLILENHYKDGAWIHPEFAQPIDIFVDLIARIDHPSFGINYDPSNTIVAGEDPLEMLEHVKHRVVTMHASDRYLKEGTLEDLRREENVVGYASRLSHGVIGQGMNDYDAIFSTLAAVGFDGWISIEDGEDGFDQMHESARFLRRKIAEHWPEG
ncbi:MAG: myo-inositol catabolism protein IolH [Phycisphaeraceae bacterium]|nr:myo-inositol catabolism protein IolH [Phycisphaeraceae bacterium]